MEYWNVGLIPILHYSWGYQFKHIITREVRLGMVRLENLHSGSIKLFRIRPLNEWSPDKNSHPKCSRHLPQ